MKVLVVGLGSIARKHIIALKSLRPEVGFYAWRSSISSPKQPEIIDLFTEKQISEHFFDFAIISNPTSEHRKTLSKLIALQIPLFIEKPLFDRVGLDEELVLEKIKAAEIPTYVACNLRFLQSIQFIRTAIEKKRINEVNIYCGSYLPDWRPGVDFRKVYSANKDMGGGVHIDLIHELDYAFWLFGKPLDSDTLFSKSSSLNISAFDYANYRWQYRGFTANIILNYYRKDAKRTLEILCDEGTYHVDLLTNHVSYCGETVFMSEQKIADTYQDQMAFFLENITSGTNLNFNTAFQGYKILNLCLNQS